MTTVYEKKCINGVASSLATGTIDTTIQDGEQTSSAIPFGSSTNRTVIGL